MPRFPTHLAFSTLSSSLLGHLENITYRRPNKRSDERPRHPNLCSLPVSHFGSVFFSCFPEDKTDLRGDNRKFKEKDKLPNLLKVDSAKVAPNTSGERKTMTTWLLRKPFFLRKLGAAKLWKNMTLQNVDLGSCTSCINYGK